MARVNRRKAMVEGQARLQRRVANRDRALDRALAKVEVAGVRQQLPRVRRSYSRRPARACAKQSRKGRLRCSRMAQPLLLQRNWSVPKVAAYRRVRGTSAVNSSP